MNIFEKMFSSSKKDEPTEKEKEIVRERLSHIGQTSQVEPTNIKSSPSAETEIRVKEPLAQEQRQVLEKELAAKVEHLKMLQPFSQHRNFRTSDDAVLEEKLKGEIKKIREKLDE